MSVLLSLLLSLRAQGSRTLIFSQSRVMLDLIEVRTRAGRCAVVTLLQVVLSDPCAAASALQLQEDGSNMRAFKCVRIDGSISSSSERQALIAQFNCDRSIDAFLLTTQVNSKLHRVLHRKTRDTLQCGGVGITLNGADRVVIFDPAWNPAVDAQVSSRFCAHSFALFHFAAFALLLCNRAQAVDRCYRVGQTKDVIVYRFITCGTIEEKVYRKQVFKGGLERVRPPPSSSPNLQHQTP